jgi:Ca2+-binding RTX toxin-like protein
MNRWQSAGASLWSEHPEGARVMAQNIITGTEGRDRLYGTEGSDLINGLAGKDHLHGLGGDDVLHGGLDDDILWGGAGDDEFFVDTTGEKIFEHRDEGFDHVISSISYELGNNLEVLFLTGGEQPLQATGNRLDNLLVGNFGDNVLSGELGNDTLDGNAGRDTYLFDTKPGPENVDVVRFVAGEDLIALDSRIFAGISGPDAFQNGPAALDSQGRIIFDPETGALVYDPDGTGPALAVQFATLTGVAGPLSEADFVLV